MKFRRFLQNFFGYGLLMLSLSMLAQGGKGIIGGLIMIVAGLIVIPQSRAILEKKFNTHFARPFKYFAAITGYFAISVFGRSRLPQNNTSHSTRQEVTTNADTEPPKSTGIIVNNDTLAHASSMQSLKSTAKPEKEATSEPLKPINTNNNKISLKTETKNSVVTHTAQNRNNYTKEKSVAKTSHKGYGKSYTSGRSGYIRGPRGGCYYINSNGNKVYVAHSYCN